MTNQEIVKHIENKTEVKDTNLSTNTEINEVNTQQKDEIRTVEGNDELDTVDTSIEYTVKIGKTTYKFDTADAQQKVESLLNYINQNNKIPPILKLAYKVIIDIVLKNKFITADSHNDENYRCHSLSMEEINKLNSILTDNPDNPPSIKQIVNKYFENRHSYFLFLVKSHIRHNPKHNNYQVYRDNMWQIRDRIDMALEIKSLAFELSVDNMYCNTDNYREFINNLKHETFVTKFLNQVPILDDEFNFENLPLTSINNFKQISGKKQNVIPLYYDNFVINLFQQDAKAPKWNDFLSQIFDNNKELIDYVQTVVGYCLSQKNRERACFFLIGSGANGKTTFLEVLKKLFAHQAVIIDNTIFTKNGKSSQKEYRKLINRSIAIINEMDFNSIIKGAIFKILTGGDTMELNDGKSQTSFFKNNAKFIIASNTIPTFDENSDAIWERIRIIPFNVKFERENRNLFLLDELVLELPGILNWAIEGYKIWENNKGLIEPQCVIDEIENARDTLDPIKDFIKDECEAGIDKTVLSKDLYKRYCHWCKDTACSPIGQNKFGIMITQKGYNPKRMTKGRGFIGLCLKAETDETQL